MVSFFLPTYPDTLMLCRSADDTTGVTGSIDASAHLGFHPGQHPAAELDVSSDWNIQGVLAKWWKNGPMVTIASGTVLDHRVL